VEGGPKKKNNVLILSDSYSEESPVRRNTADMYINHLHRPGYIGILNIVELTFTELRERDGSIVYLIRTRPDVQTGFVANSHRRHFRQPNLCNE